ncbi:hypothetical protein C3E97_015010 [Pseudomonas sp. MWU12-2115]|nr:hypothetical protein C3E97_015010 [Pseudomonas sp. MWU12-2115]
MYSRQLLHAVLRLRDIQSIFAPPQSPCGSGLAHESGASFNEDVGCPNAFASKPASTKGHLFFRDIVAYCRA